MKKIFFPLIACAALLTSCDMDTPQPGVLDDQTAISGAQEALYFRNYLYNQMRSMSCGGWVYYSDLQMDQFIGLTTNGNRGGYLSTGDFDSSTSTFNEIWVALYSRIANANYFIEKADALVKGGGLTEEEEAEVKRYIGEAHFARANAYYYLMDKWCQTPANTDIEAKASGLPLVTVYNPNGDPASYPGRSTLAKTIKLIEDDLTVAFDALEAYEQAGNTAYCMAGSSYLSTYAVNALRARLSLVCGNYKKAIEYADYVISNTNYELAEGEDYINMWFDENVSELIFAPFVDASESSSIASTGEGWNYWLGGDTQTDYLPMSDVVWSYLTTTDSGNVVAADIRFSAFLVGSYINVQGGTDQAYIFYKYPGNDNLILGANYFKNTPKPFRLSEQYLIKAEAAAMLNQTATAQAAIDAIRSKRVASAYFTPCVLTGNSLIQAARDERSRELIGEGFRLSDQRRWKAEWNRQGEYEWNPAVESSFLIADRNTHYTSDDHRYLWPIPANEIEINPQIKNQQNKGY